MLYLIRWVICLSCVMWCKEGELSASGWTCIGSDNFNETDVHLQQDDIVMRVEFADPLKRVTAEDVSIESCLAALRKKDESLSHDSAMRLLVKYNSMVDSNERTELREFLESVAQNLVESAKQNFQRDYIVLWQAYVFFMKMVPSVHDPSFWIYSQRASNLADAHEDEARIMFVVGLFRDKLTASVGKFIARKIIISELKIAVDRRFLQCVICFWDHQSNLTPPPYDQAVSALASPPPYDLVKKK